MCQPCWNARHPGRTGHTVTGAREKVCCYCGEHTTAGIFVRDDPTATRCKGLHATRGEQ